VLWIVDEIPANLGRSAQEFLKGATKKLVSSLAQPAAERPEVAFVRHPIADARNNVVGYELRFGGSVDLGDPASSVRRRRGLGERQLRLGRGGGVPPAAFGPAVPHTGAQLECAEKRPLDSSGESSGPKPWATHGFAPFDSGGGAYWTETAPRPALPSPLPSRS
jgi:hypothetical protein